jgi:hypothetical protein
MMASTGPAARIPAEAQDTPTSLLAREASELRQTEFYSVGPVFLFALRWFLAGEVSSNLRFDKSLEHQSARYLLARG